MDELVLERENDKEKIRRILGGKLHGFSISADRVQIWLKTPLTSKEETDISAAFPNHQKKNKRTLTKEEEKDGIQPRVKERLL